MLRNIEIFINYNLDIEECLLYLTMLIVIL